MILRPNILDNWLHGLRTSTFGIWEVRNSKVFVQLRIAPQNPKTPTFIVCILL